MDFFARIQPGPARLTRQFLTSICLLVITLPVMAAPPFSGTIFVNPDIIQGTDTSTFISLTEAGQGTRNEFDRRVDNFVNFQAFLFQASYSDMENIEIQVNTEFGSVAAARVEAERFAFVVGQMPFALKRDLDTVTIHQGDQPYGGGNNNLLIHTGSFQDGYIADGILEETVAHELSHTSLDLRYQNNPAWLGAQSSDPEFISTYALENPNREDIAESFVMWMGLRYVADRIPGSLISTIESTMPARVAFFDSLTLNMAPLEEAAAQEFSIPDAVFTLTNNSVDANLTAGATDSYRFVFNSPGNFSVFTTGDLDTRAELLDDNGTLVNSDDDGAQTGLNFQIDQAVAAGTYYLQVSGFNASTSGSYTLVNEFESTGPREIDLSKIDSSSLTPNTPAQGTLAAADTRYFRVDSPALADLSVSVTSPESDDLVGYLYDSNGVELLTRNTLGSGQPLVLELADVLGTYYVGFGFNSAFASGNFSVTASLDFAEQPAEPEQPTTLDVSSIDAPNVNWFILDPVIDEITAGSTFYRSVILPGEANLTVTTVSDIDTFGILYDEEGNQLLIDDESGEGNQFLLFRFVPPGKYYIAVSGATDADVGSVELKVDVEFAQEVTTADFTNAIAVSLDDPEFEELDVGETVYFRLEVPESGTLFISTVSAFDTYGYLYDDQATPLLADDDSGTGNQFLLEYEAEPGTYFIGVHSFNVTGSGTFTLNATLEAAQDSAGPDSTLDITSIDAPNVDWFILDPVIDEITAGSTFYRSVILPGEANLTVTTVSDIDTFGILYDEDGNQLLIDDESGEGNQFLLFRFVPPGKYYIAVSGATDADVGSVELKVDVEFADVITVDDFSDAPSVTPNTPAFAELTAGGTLFFRVDLPATGTLSVSTVSDFDTYGYLYAADATPLLADDDSGTGNQFLLTYEGAPGTYYIGVLAVDLFNAGNFTLNVAVDFAARQRPVSSLPLAEKVRTVGGAARNASFGLGAYADNGAPAFASNFTAGDFISIIGEVAPDPIDVGTNGELFVAMLSVVSGRATFLFLNEDGLFEEWDTTVPNLGAAKILTPLEESHEIEVFEGTLQAGVHKITFAYQAEGGPLVYMKPITVRVSP